jgi:ubiquinone/menaquinone biosynthesis C-methylase UbiE
MANSQEQEQKAVYTWRDSTAVKVHGGRTAENVAGFYTPHLKPGMRLLDCGCGPGTITVGLAQLVAPGEVIGIDADPRHIKTAQANASAAGVANVHFQTGDVYDLGFEDDSFDAVFCHALLEHLHNPVSALREMRRVLKRDGLMGVREFDLDSALLFPDEPILRRIIELWIRLTRHNGGDAQIGKHLFKLLSAADLRSIAMSATTELYGLAALVSFAPNEVTLEQWMFLLGESSKHGWITEVEMNQIRQAAQAWCERPDSLLVAVRCEALARK